MKAGREGGEIGDSDFRAGGSDLLTGETRMDLPRDIIIVHARTGQTGTGGVVIRPGFAYNLTGLSIL